MDQTSELIIQSIKWWPAAGQIVLAGLLGGMIGVERLWGYHPAGLRTNMLIAIASCLFTILSIGGFPLRGSAQDTARIAAQIVTGVGFLGAGAVLQTRRSVHGLTTAATIWLVAAIGMAVGAGAYFISIFTTLVALVALAMLSPISTRLEQRARDRRKQDRTGQKENDEIGPAELDFFTDDDEEDEGRPGD